MERDNVSCEPKKFPLRHDMIIGTIVASILKCVFRYLLMAAYIYTCKEFGLYNYGLVAKIVVTIISVCMSRWTLREFGRIIGDELDEPPFQTVGIVACIREIRMITGRW